MNPELRAKLDRNKAAARAEFGRVLTESNRIASLPRREEPDEIERELMALAAWDDLRRPDAKTPTPFLFPMQGWALHELAQYRCLAAPIAVGGGKTWVLALAPTVLGVDRALVLTKASLVKQTEQEIRKLRQWFHIFPEERLRVMSYERLSTSGLLDLVEFDPELIIADEAHCLRNLDSNRSRRLFHWMLHERATQPLFIPMSGTITGHSIEHYHHLYDLALGEGSPVPRDETIDTWASALDAGNKPPREHVREVARVLGCPAGIEAARKALGLFCRNTPGVVTSDENEIGIGLEIHCLRNIDLGGAREALHRLRTKWELPDGTELVEAVHMAAHASTLALGFWNHREPAPGTDPDLVEEWLEARRGWNGLVDVALGGPYRHRAGFDSPGLLAERGRENVLGLWLQEAWDRWSGVEDRVEWLEEHRWVERGIVADALACIPYGPNTVIWFMSDALTEVFEEMGIPVFGPGSPYPTARDAEGSSWPGVIAAKVQVHGTGWNGQFDFSRQIWLEVPTTSDVWEQGLGRQHRPGQPLDTVEAYVAQWTPEQIAAFATAQDRSRHYETTVGGKMKLTSYATFVKSAR